VLAARDSAAIITRVSSNREGTCEDQNRRLRAARRRALRVRSTPGGSSRSSPARMAPIVSPEIATDGRVTFRLRAPSAKEVYVSGIGQPAPPAAAPVAPAGAPPPGGRRGGPRLDMQMNEQGVWSATTPEPMPPGIYQYTFNVDGLRIADPGNNKFQTGFNSASSSRLVVPGGLWTPAPGSRAERSRGTSSIPPSPATTATSGSTRPPAMTRRAQSPTLSSSCSTGSATRPTRGWRTAPRT